MQKVFSIGVNTEADKDHFSRAIGFVVIASNSDESYQRVLDYCAQEFIKLKSGHVSQRRGENDIDNAWFDRNYPIFKYLR